MVNILETPPRASALGKRMTYRKQNNMTDKGYHRADRGHVANKFAMNEFEFVREFEK